MDKLKTLAKEYGAFLLLCLQMSANLLYMHCEVYFSNYPSQGLFRPLFFCVLDVLLPLFLFSVVTWGRRRVAFLLTYVLLLLFVLSNVLYSRFFQQYITLGAFGELSNFLGTWWLGYLRDAFRWTDLLLVANTALFAYVLRLLKPGKLLRDIVAMGVIALVAFLFYMMPLTSDARSQMHSWADARRWATERCAFGDPLLSFRMTQESAVVMNGIFLGQLYCNVAESLFRWTLTQEERAQVDRFLQVRQTALLPLPDSCTVQGTPNIVFLLVESYLSTAATMQVDGQYVMPNLVSLMHEEGTYTCLEMSSQRGAGMSSDAQVSYLTGLIPLPAEISISHLQRDSVVALPRLLSEQRHYHTYITVPTVPEFWHQRQLNDTYGIDTMFSFTEDVGMMGDDKQLFDKLRREKLQEPFFNLILTATMHGPYDGADAVGGGHEPSSLHYPREFSAEWRCYLDKCRETDTQIGQYLQYLRREGLYERSVIIVASDHEPMMESLGTDTCSEDLPLIIVGSGIPTNRFRQGRINQIDLYPTMLDMFGLQTHWRGLGHSLLRPGYSPDITPQAQEVSERMMKGNYFPLR